MNLTFEFSMRVAASQPIFVGPGPAGMRLVGPVAEGTFEGERLRGTMVGPGADWLVVRPDGWGNIDVRLQLQTHDGAVIYVSYTGLIDVTEKLQNALVGGATTEYGEQYWRTTPRLETGDPRYAWVNHTLFLGEGRVTSGPTVEYRVYRVD